MPLRILTAAPGEGLTTHLRSLITSVGRFIAIGTPTVASWWALPHALGVRGGSLIPAIGGALLGSPPLLIIDCPFVVDALARDVLACLEGVPSGVDVVIGFEGGVKGENIPSLEPQLDGLPSRLVRMARGCGVCLHIGQSTVQHVPSDDYDRMVSDLSRDVAPLAAFMKASLSTLPTELSTRFVRLGTLVHPDTEAVIDNGTLSILWGTDFEVTKASLSSIRDRGLINVDTDSITIHKLITTLIHKNPDKHVTRLLDTAKSEEDDTPFLRDHRVRLELATNRRRDAVNTALNYTSTRGRSLHASTDFTALLKRWPTFQPSDRVEFCVTSEEVEEGFQLLADALFKAGVYAHDDLTEEAYQIYGRLCVWRGRNAVVRRFLIDLDLFGCAVRRAEKNTGRRSDAEE